MDLTQTRALQPPYFDRGATRILKGTALVLMFIHHFFTFQGWYVEGISYPGMTWFADIFCLPTEICVPVFAFLTGYFYCFRQDKSYACSLRKILDILIPYWVVYLLFLLIAAATGTWLGLRNTAMELLALKDPIMVFCWYVQFYCLTMLLLPVLVRFLPESLPLSFVLGILLPTVVLNILVPMASPYPLLHRPLFYLQQYFTTVIMGCLFARHDLFRTWLDTVFSGKSDSWLRRVLWVVFLVVLCYCRRVLKSYSFGAVCYRGSELPVNVSLDIFYAPCFIYGILRLLRGLDQPGLLRRGLAAVGTESMLMWFLHCIFFNVSAPVFQPILYFPRTPILVVLWGLGLCYAAARLISPVCSRLIRLKDRLLGKP